MRSIAIASGLLLVALMLVALVGFWVWPRPVEPAPWGAGRLTTLNRQEPPVSGTPQLRGWSEGQVSVAVAVGCATPADGTRPLSVQFHTLRDDADAEMHTLVIAVQKGGKQRAQIGRFAMAEIATDGGPARAINLALDASGSRVALALVRDADGFRIGKLDPANGLVDFFTSLGLRLHARRTFAVRLPVGDSAAVSRLGTDALVSFLAACG